MSDSILKSDPGGCIFVLLEENIAGLPAAILLTITIEIQGSVIDNHSLIMDSDYLQQINRVSVKQSLTSS